MHGDQFPSPFFSEVFESGIGAADEVQLFLATPTLELLFAADGSADVFVALEVEKPGAVMGFREAFEDTVLCCQMRRLNLLVTPM